MKVVKKIKVDSNKIQWSSSKRATYIAEDKDKVKFLPIEK
jgi:hypothetical protein